MTSAYGNTSDTKIEIFPAFGPPKNSFMINTNEDEILNNILRVIFSLFKFGVHTQIILLKNGMELTGTKNSLKELDIRDGDRITLSVKTPYMPLHSVCPSEVDGIDIARSSTLTCMEHAHNNPMVEVGGLLVGRESDKNKLTIDDCIPISTGNNISVFINPVKLAKTSEDLRLEKKYIVGWYHSHVISKPFSSIDARLQSAYQRLYPNTIAMVIDNQKKSINFYRVNNIQPLVHVKQIFLNNRNGGSSNMESDAVTLTAMVEMKESAQILSLTCSDTEPGNTTTFKVMCQNTGTVPLTGISGQLLITSPDNRETISLSSEPFSLQPNETKTLFIKGNIGNWPGGSATVRSKIVNAEKRIVICYGPTEPMKIKLLPIHDVQLKVLQASPGILPGHTASYVIQVKNNGNQTDNIEINLDGEVPTSWTVKVHDGKDYRNCPFIITLEAGTSKRLVVMATAPSTGRGGERAPITVKARYLP